MTEQERVTERLLAHVGHDVHIVTYADENVTLECEKCYEVIVDYDYKENN